MSAVITTLQDRLSQPIPLPTSLLEAKLALRTAQKECRRVVSKARDLAKTHQENRILAKQLANPDKDPETIAKSSATEMTRKKCGAKYQAANPNRPEE